MKEMSINVNGSITNVTYFMEFWINVTNSEIINFFFLVVVVLFFLLNYFHLFAFFLLYFVRISIIRQELFHFSNSSDLF